MLSGWRIVSDWFIGNQQHWMYKHTRQQCHFSGGACLVLASKNVLILFFALGFVVKVANVTVLTAESKDGNGARADKIKVTEC